MGKSEVEGRFRMNPQPKIEQFEPWRYVAEQLLDEKDPEKIVELAVELNCLLEREEKLGKQREEKSRKHQQH
jgi:hypothetical protein